MKNNEQQEHKTCQMWNSATQSFETWHIGACEVCGKSVDPLTGECKEYKCWI
jgi:hypothetical protein